ncbi:MAG: hypothetical protein ABR534_10465 [Desulfotignum sp.]
MESLTKELGLAFKGMAKAKNIEQKEAYSRVIKNLCESLGVFLDFASTMPFEDMYDEDEDDYE